MQILAMLTMLIDHIGIAFFPQETSWRIVGRIAFPLYAFALVQGYTHTRDKGRYMGRLIMIGAISQIPYMWALQVTRVNVIGTFLVSFLVLLAWDRSKNRGVRAITLAGALLLLEGVPFDYGGYGLLLVLIYRYASPASGLLLHFGLNLLYVWVKDWYIQLVSLLSSFFIYMLADYRVQKQSRKRVVPRWLWLSFYPAHLAVLAAVRPGPPSEPAIGVGLWVYAAVVWFLVGFGYVIAIRVRRSRRQRRVPVKEEAE